MENQNTICGDDMISRNQRGCAQSMENIGAFISDMLFTPQQPSQEMRMAPERSPESTSDKIARLLF